MKKAFEREYWFIFGTYDDGCVDIADSSKDVLTHISYSLSEKIVAAHNEALDRLEDYINT